MQCYSAHSTCYSVLAVLELFYVFSKVSSFMLILMNIKNKLKCENNYLIRDRKQFNFYCRDSRARAFYPQTRRHVKRQIQLSVQFLLPPAPIQPAHISYSGGEISLKYFTFFSFFSQCLISLEWKTTLPLPVGSCFFLGRASSREFRLRLVFIFVHLESQSWSNRQPTLGN